MRTTSNALFYPEHPRAALQLLMRVVARVLAHSVMPVMRPHLLRPNCHVGVLPQ